MSEKGKHKKGVVMLQRGDRKGLKKLMKQSKGSKRSKDSNNNNNSTEETIGLLNTEGLATQLARLSSFQFCNFLQSAPCGLCST